MKKLIVGCLFIFLITILSGCSGNPMANIEKTLLDNHYWINVTYSDVDVIKKYQNEATRGWNFAGISKEGIAFKDDCLIYGVSVDTSNGELDFNTGNYKPTEDELKKLKEASDKEIEKLGLTYEQLLEYFNYKLEEDPVSKGYEEMEIIKEYPTKIVNDTKYNYVSMVSEIENGSKNREGTWYYMNLGYRLHHLQDTIKTEPIEEYEENFTDIFGFVPNDLKEANKLIDDLQEIVVWDDSNYHLHDVLNFFLKSDFVSTEQNDKSGFMIVNDIDNLLEEQKISAKSLSCLLGVFKDYGADISFEHNSIKILWSKETRGYYYCLTEEQMNKFNNWFKNEATKNFSTNFKKISNNIGYVDFSMPNPRNLKFDYIVFNTIIFEEKKEVDRFYTVVNNTNNNPITIHAKFKNAKYDTNYNFEHRVVAKIK